MIRRFCLWAVFTVYLCVANIAFANTITKNLVDINLAKDSALIFDCSTPVSISVKFLFTPPESSFGKPTAMFDIVIANDTISICQGIQSIGTFEPSPFLMTKLNNSESFTFSQTDNLVKSNSQTTFRLTANNTTGIRVFINGHAADLKITPQQFDKIKIVARQNISFPTINLETSQLDNTSQLLPLDQIAQRLSHSTDKLAGLYCWLDRENDPQKAIPGGYYKLAVIPDSIGGYDIIYLDGATVNKDAWKPGMLKGKLKKTIFLNHFDLVWYDSNHLPLDREVFCNFTDNSIMELQFPLYSTRMRFSRLTESDASLTLTR